MTTAACAPSGAAPSVPAPTVSGSAALPMTAAPASGSAFGSTRYGYRLAMPTGWSVVETPGTGGLHPDEPGVDTYRDHRGHIVSVVGETLSAGSGLSTWTCAIGRHLGDEHDAPVESTESLTVAGVAARLTRYHVRFDPYVVHYLNIELIEGDIGLTLSMESTTGGDAADEALLRALLEGLSLTGT